MSLNSVDARLAWRLAPEVVFAPDVLDFGQLAVNVKELRELYVSNLSGPMYGCSVVCSDDTSWFRIVYMQPVEDTTTGARLKIVIEVDTNLLSPGQRFTGWIAAQVEHVQTRIPVTVTISGERSIPRPNSHWLQTFSLTLLAIILVSGGLSLLSSTRAAALTSTLLADFAQLRPWPDRDLISFSAYTGSKLMLYTTTAAAPEQQKLDIAGWSPAWSPDGTNLVLLAAPAGTPELYLIDTSHNAAPLQLTNSSEPKSAPAWSPDGSKIAFIAGPPAQGMLQIVNSRSLLWGSGTPAFAAPDRQVTAVNAMMRKFKQGAQARGAVKHFAWSPDGSTVLFDYYQADQVRILQVGADGAIDEVVMNSWSPTWSPSGNEIAAVAANGLFRLALADHERYYLSRQAAHAPAWSPDGSRIAFLVGNASADQRAGTPALALWVVDATGDHEIFLADDCVSFAWSPDGQRLAYVTGDVARNGTSAGGDHAQAPLELYYLWATVPGAPPTLLAEVNSPSIAWQPLP